MTSENGTLPSCPPSRLRIDMLPAIGRLLGDKRLKRADVFDFVLLAALWGASFLFMRVGAPEFGPVTLIALRVLIAAVCLWPLLWLRVGEAGFSAVKANLRPLAVVGIMNSALPFCLLAYASLSLTAGFASLINATVPLWAAAIGAVFLQQRLAPAQWIGLSFGVVGMVVLTWGRVDFKPGGSGVALAAGLVATLSYGFSTHFARRALVGVAPLAVATGSQTAAALVLLPLAPFFWPPAMPSANAWISLFLLATFSTALAYILFFRLIARLGGQMASTVTFAIPVFAMLWGALFLGETVTALMGLGGAIVLLGTALAMGILRDMFQSKKR
jgi:drug/metabolite transporter (DMT)-like permease